MIKKIIFLLTYLITLLIVIVWTYENSDKVDSLKNKLKKYQKKDYSLILEKNENIFIIEANSFNIKTTKVISLEDKTAFVLNRSKNKQFNINNVEIYFQNGYFFSNQSTKRLTLNKNFTLEFDGGIKNIFFFDDKTYSFNSSLEGKCYYASITNLYDGEEVLRSKCLKINGSNETIDFNGLGSSFVEFDDFILLSVGTPATNSNSINLLAQNKDSLFGKILKINKSDLEKNLITPEVFSLGHRNPQGITKYKNKIFSVEHGPKGGDELNILKENQNYGWPFVSYGTRYLYDNDGKKYLINHEIEGFEPPIYSFIPSVGISSLNNCPKILQNYYKKNCLIALSLNGNPLRSGNSLIIFLLDEGLNKVQAVEKISFKPHFALRHFITNEKNEIFVDEDNSIYIAIDNRGIYKFTFTDFR